jgi:single-strand DNA-binding protein
MNNAIFTGNIGKEPELKRTQSGKEVLSFSLGVYDGKDQSGQSKTLWVECSLWGEAATRNEGKFAKGQHVAVSGIVGVRAWVDKNIGEARCAATLMVNAIDGGPSRDNGQQSSRKDQSPPPKASAPSYGDLDDSLPF